MGYTDLGAFGGHDIPTPNLDALAMEGIRLTNFHANVSCAPTRAMLLSGTGNHEAGMGSQRALEIFAGPICRACNNSKEKSICFNGAIIDSIPVSISSPLAVERGTEASKGRCLSTFITLMI